VQGQLRQLKAVIGERELEVKSLDEKMDALRERMNESRTNKEYQALLTEVNTYKVRKGELESEELELMGKVEELTEESASLAEQKDERTKMKAVAEAQRAEREEGIKQQVEELKAEREQLASEPPAGVMAIYDGRWETFDDADEVMGPVEEQDRRRGEYTCGACMMTIPFESVSALLSHGNLTQCVSCGVILYMESELREALQAKSKKKAGSAS